MPDDMGISDIGVLQAMERLRDEWPALLGDDAGELARLLDATPKDDPEAVHRTAERIRHLVQAHSEAQARLKLLPIPAEVRAAFEPLPGEPGEVPAGTWMVCPKDPTHYRRRLRQKGQRLFCPEHGVELVPAREE